MRFFGLTSPNKFLATISHVLCPTKRARIIMCAPPTAVESPTPASPVEVPSAERKGQAERKVRRPFSAPQGNRGDGNFRSFQFFACDLRRFITLQFNAAVSPQLSYGATQSAKQ